MQIPSLIDQDEIPPPPYTPQSPSSPTGEFFSTLPVRPSLRGGYIRPTVSSGAPDFVSAEAYFEGRPSIIQPPSDILEHHITVPTGATRESLYFPHPERKYQERDVRVMDWYTFVNYLIPDQPEPLVTKEKKPDDEDSDEGYERIEAVVAEWNEGFFCPRGVRILCDIWPLEAPAYGSLIDLSGNHLPVNTPLQSTPMEVGSSKTAIPDHGNTGRQRHHQCGPHSHHRRSSIASTTSTSSSSSFSSCSIESFSSGDLAGTNFPQVIGTLLSLRHDPARKSNLKASIQKIGKDLRSQRRALPRHERKQWSREFKTELHAQKKAIKIEVKSLIKEAKATHKAEKKTRKAERGAKRETRRAERKEGKKCSRRNQRRQESSTLAVVEVEREMAAARVYEAKARALESELHARAKAHEAQAWAYEREMRDRDVAYEREMRDKDLAYQRERRDRDLALEKEVKNRDLALEKEVRDGDVAYEREMRNQDLAHEKEMRDKDLALEKGGCEKCEDQR